MLVRIEPSKESPFGAFEGWGTSLCWWANYFGDLPERQRKELVKVFFDQKEGLGLNIARYNIGGGDAPGHNHIRPDGGAVPGYLSEDGKWDFSADIRQLNILKDCIEMGVNIVECFSNSPPYFMTVSGCASGAEDPNEDNIDPSMYDTFADYLTEVVKFLNGQGIKVSTLEPMNEPYTNYWEKMGRQEGCHISPGENQSALILAVARKLKEKGLHGTVVSASDETSTDKALESLRMYSPEALGAIGQINTHTYGTNNIEELRDEVLKRGKRLYMSETDHSSAIGNDAKSMGPALWFSHKVTSDLKALKALAWVIWQVTGPAREHDHPDRGYWYLSSYDKGTYTLNLFKKYYAFAHFTKFIKPGFFLIDNSSENILTAYDKETRKIVIVETNAYENEQNYVFDLSGFDFLPTKAEVYRTSLTQDLERLDDIEITSRRFSAATPVNTITTFVVY